jgi:phosphoribosylformylglycinamidine (FGAM) synthase-like enzyme
MATLEELTVVATQEIEDAKPMYAQVNNERREFTDSEYDQAIVDLANSKFDTQENGYKTARQEAYNSIQDQLDMQYWDGVNGTTLWAEHIAQVKADNPKPA